MRALSYNPDRKLNDKDGVGTNSDYVKFFREQVVPKCKPLADGKAILEVRPNDSHNTFVGSNIDGLYVGSNEFLRWINEALKKIFLHLYNHLLPISF